MDGSVDVLAVIRAPLEQYPPSLFQVALLAEAGLRVAVVETTHSEIKQAAFTQTVRRIDGGRHLLLYREELPSQWQRIRNFFKFVGVTRRALRETSPKVVIAYDDRGCAVLGQALSRSNRPRVISHFHELSVHNRGDGLGGWQAHRYCGRFARESDLVIFPDSFRAQIFQERVRLDRPPTIVMNCPRQVAELPANMLTAKLAAAGLANHRVVLFQGWMGPNRGLETLIESMAFWPADSALVLVGPARADYRQSLESLAVRGGRRQRVLFIEMVSLAELNTLVAGADVAVALFPSETEDLNFRYLAGASNKRFMYMSLGVAQVTNTGPGMNEIIEEPRCGRLVNPTVPEEVGRAITELLADGTLRKELGQNGRRAHLNRFNYEHQFAPVLAKIKEWCREARQRR